MEHRVTLKPGLGASGADLLLLEGFLNVQNIGAIKENILKELPSDTALHVKTENVEQLDVSFLQLLLSLKLRFRNERRPVYFDLLLNKEMEDILNASGFNELLSGKQ